MLTRKELALAVFNIVKTFSPTNSEQLWIKIAETDDETLRRDYMWLIQKNWSFREWQKRKDEQEQEEEQRVKEERKKR